MLTRSPQLTRRPATADDHHYLRQLFAESRDDLLLLPAGVRDTLVGLQYEGQRRQIAADRPDATTEVLVADGTDVGVLVLDCHPARVHVVDIVVARGERGRGIATGALRAVIEEAGDRTVTLLVWAGNAVARSLYERLGFVTASPSSADSGEGHIAMEHRPVR